MNSLGERFAWGELRSLRKLCCSVLSFLFEFWLLFWNFRRGVIFSMNFIQVNGHISKYYDICENIMFSGTSSMGTVTVGHVDPLQRDSQLPMHPSCTGNRL